MQLRKELTDAVVKAVSMPGINVDFIGKLNEEETNELIKRGIFVHIRAIHVGNYEYTLKYMK